MRHRFAAVCQRWRRGGHRCPLSCCRCYVSRSVVQAHSRVGAAHRPVLAPFLVAALLSSPQLTQQQGEPAGVAARRVRPEKRCSVQYSDDTVVDDRLTDTLACLFFPFFFKKKGNSNMRPRSLQPPLNLHGASSRLSKSCFGSVCCSAPRVARRSCCSLRSAQVGPVAVAPAADPMAALREELAGMKTGALNKRARELGGTGRDG